MINIAIDFDMSGHSYDPDNPTVESEKLCYKLNAILDQMKVQGLSIRQRETQDVTDAESFLSALYDDVITPPEEAPTFETPTNEDMLLDGKLYLAIVQARNKLLIKTLERMGGVGEVNQVISDVNETLRLMLTKEQILYLSDGTPIYVNSGLIA